MKVTAAMLKSDRTVAARDREVRGPMLAALVYDVQTYRDDIFKQVVDRCRTRGFRLAGS